MDLVHRTEQAGTWHRDTVEEDKVDIEGDQGIPSLVSRHQFSGHNSLEISPVVHSLLLSTNLFTLEENIPNGIPLLTTSVS